MTEADMRQISASICYMPDQKTFQIDKEKDYEGENCDRYDS